VHDYYKQTKNVFIFNKSFNRVSPLFVISKYGRHQKSILIHEKENKVGIPYINLWVLMKVPRFKSHRADQCDTGCRIVGAFSMGVDRKA